MSGSSIQLANGSFTNGLKATLTVPDRTSMLGEYLFGTDSTHSARNMANNAAPLTLTGAGTPVYTSASILLSGSASFGSGIAGFDTGIPIPVGDVTFVAVRKKMTAGSLTGQALSWFGNAGFTGFLELDNWNFYNNQGGVPPAAPKITTPVDSSFHLQVGVGPNAGAGVLYVGSGGVLSSNTGGTVGGSRSAPGANILLCPAGNYQMELAYAAIYNRALSAGEVASLYTSLTAFLATRGVTVN